MHPQLQRCYDLAIKGAWNHPFFLIPLGHCEWHEGTPEVTKTMGISSVIKQGKPEINLYVNTDWVKGLPDDEVFGALSHEILHAMLRHHERGGGKNAENWGKAADMAINASLQQAQIKIPASGLLPPRDHWEDAAEDLYALLEAEEINQPKNYDPDKVGQGCMPKSGGDGSEPGKAPDSPENGDGEGSGDGSDESETPGQGQGQGNSDRAWGEMIAQSQAYGRGTGTAKVMAKLFKPKPVKTPWKRLLKRVAHRAQAKGGRDMQTYKRINRRSEDIIFPGWQSTSPSIAVIMDTSGSVSDDMLRSALASVKEIVKTTSVKVFMALHDGECYFSGWMRPEVTIDEISAKCDHRGGTDPAGAFAALAAAKGRFDDCVYLTDGEVGTYPDKPVNTKHMIVGLLGEGRYRSPTPPGWQEVLVDLEANHE